MIADTLTPAEYTLVAFTMPYYTCPSHEPAIGTALHLEATQTLPGSRGQQRICYFTYYDVVDGRNYYLKAVMTPLASYLSSYVAPTEAADFPAAAANEVPPLGEVTAEEAAFGTAALLQVRGNLVQIQAQANAAALAHQKMPEYGTEIVVLPKRPPPPLPCVGIGSPPPKSPPLALTLHGPPPLATVAATPKAPPAGFAWPGPPPQAVPAVVFQAYDSWAVPPSPPETHAGGQSWTWGNSSWADQGWEYR